MIRRNNLMYSFSIKTFYRFW